MKLIQYSCLEPFYKEVSGCLLFVLFLQKTKRRLKYVLITENSRGFYVAFLWFARTEQSEERQLTGSVDNFSWLGGTKGVDISWDAGPVFDSVLICFEEILSVYVWLSKD